MTYNIVMPFLNETMKNIIEINYEKTTSTEVTL
jgi:hypothetical protein